MPTHVMNIFAKFHWNLFTSYRDIASCEIGVNGQTTDRRTDRRKTQCLSPPIDHNQYCRFVTLVYSLCHKNAHARQTGYSTSICWPPRCTVARGVSGRNGAGDRPATDCNIRLCCEIQPPTSRRLLMPTRARIRPGMRTTRRMTSL